MKFRDKDTNLFISNKIHIIQLFIRIAPVVAAASFTPAPVTLATSTSGYKDIPLSNIRKVIAARLTESKATIPQYYVTQEIDVSRVLKYLL